MTPIVHRIPITPTGIAQVATKAALEELLNALEGSPHRQAPTHVIGLDVATGALRQRIIGLQGELMVAGTAALADDGKRPKDGWTLVGADFESFTYEAAEGTAAHKEAAGPAPAARELPELPEDEWLPNGRVVCYRREPSPPTFEGGRTGAPVWSKEYEAYRYVVTPILPGAMIARPHADPDEPAYLSDQSAIDPNPAAIEATGNDA